MFVVIGMFVLIIIGDEIIAMGVLFYGICRFIVSEIRRAWCKS